MLLEYAKQITCQLANKSESIHLISKVIRLFRKGRKGGKEECYKVTVQSCPDCDWRWCGTTNITAFLQRSSFALVSQNERYKSLPQYQMLYVISFHGIKIPVSPSKAFGLRLSSSSTGWHISTSVTSRCSPWLHWLQNKIWKLKRNFCFHVNRT